MKNLKNKNTFLTQNTSKTPNYLNVTPEILKTYLDECFYNHDKKDLIEKTFRELGKK